VSLYLFVHVGGIVVAEKEVQPEEKMIRDKDNR
jgi:hypothetical protein